MKLVDEGKREQAIEEFSKAIEINASLAEAYCMRGICYHEKGEHDKAITDFTIAIEIDSSFAVAYCMRGLTYCDKGQYDLGIVDFDKSINIDSTFAKAYCWRGHAYRDKGEYDKAITDLTRAIALDPKLAEAYRSRGLILKQMGRYTEAIANLEKFVILSQDSAAVKEAILLLDDLRGNEEETFPTHFTTYTGTLNLYSISYPGDWQCLVSLLDDVEQHTTDVLQSLQNNRPLGGELTLFAAGVPCEKHISPLALVIVDPLPSNWTLDDVVEDAVRNILTDAKEHKELSREQVIIDGRKTMIINFAAYLSASDTRLCYLVAVSIMDNTVWSVVCSVVADDFDNSTSDFISIVRSLRILPRKQ
jgi:hypothetical protein